MRLSTAKISIIIPVYNTAKYLRRCLASVCAQTLQDMEIICINDGSTDNSLEILKEFSAKDSRIILLEQENSGCATARNKGLEKATAPYIGFVDSDDFIAPDMYEKMYAAMIQNEVDFIECGAEMIFACQYPDDKENLRNLVSAKYNGRIEDRNLFFYTCFEIWKMLFKKDLLKRYTLHFEYGFCTHEDGLFVVSYKSIARSGYYIGENLYFYAQYENSIMGKSKAKNQGDRIVEILHTGEAYYNFLVKNGIFEQLKFFFWDFYAERIWLFYLWAAPDVIKKYGPSTIKKFLGGKDLTYLTGKRYRLIRNFAKLKEEKLQDLSSADWRLKSIVICFRKLIKICLPYGLVRSIQKHKMRIWA